MYHLELTADEYAVLLSSALDADLAVARDLADPARFSASSEELYARASRRISTVVRCALRQGRVLSLVEAAE